MFYLCTFLYIPDNVISILRSVWNVKVVALINIVGIPLLNIFGYYYIYTEFILGYFSANLAGNLQYRFLAVFYFSRSRTFYSLLYGFSYDRLSQLLEKYCLCYIQSRMKYINVIQMNHKYLIFPCKGWMIFLPPWKNMFCILCIYVFLLVQVLSTVRNILF